MLLVLLSVVFNLISDLTGGIRFTVIEEERVRLQQELQRRAEELFKKQSRAQFIGGIGLMVGGALSGNVAITAQGAGMAAGGAGGTGWF